MGRALPCHPRCRPTPRRSGEEGPRPASLRRAACAVAHVAVARESKQGQCRIPSGRGTRRSGAGTGRVRPVPARRRETSDDEALPTDRQVPTCRQKRGRNKPHRCTRACRAGRFIARRAAAPNGLPTPELLAWSTRHRRWRSAASRGVDPLTPPALRFNAARGARRAGRGEGVPTGATACSSPRTRPGRASAARGARGLRCRVPVLGGGV
jgi:hypothetical protein